jgi:hypothetical protein
VKLIVDGLGVHSRRGILIRFEISAEGR